MCRIKYRPFLYKHAFRFSLPFLHRPHTMKASQRTHHSANTLQFPQAFLSLNMLLLLPGMPFLSFFLAFSSSLKKKNSQLIHPLWYLDSHLPFKVQLKCPLTHEVFQIPPLPLSGPAGSKSPTGICIPCPWPSGFQLKWVQIQFFHWPAMGW